MSNALRILLSIGSLLVVSCTVCSSGSPVAREFLRVPDHYVGNLSRADRRFWLHTTAGDERTLQDRNLNFSYDGEQELSGEGPLAFHLFSSSGRPTVGIFI